MDGHEYVVACLILKLINHTIISMEIIRYLLRLNNMPNNILDDEQNQ